MQGGWEGGSGRDRKTDRVKESGVREKEGGRKPRLLATVNQFRVYVLP